MDQPIKRPDKVIFFKKNYVFKHPLAFIDGKRKSRKDIHAFYYFCKFPRFQIIIRRRNYLFFLVKETTGIGYTVDVDRKEFTFLGNLKLNLWDCGG